LENLLFDLSLNNPFVMWVLQITGRYRPIYSRVVAWPYWCIDETVLSRWDRYEDKDTRAIRGFAPSPPGLMVWHFWIQLTKKPSDRIFSLFNSSFHNNAISLWIFISISLRRHPRLS
jgi:hypothetical protein